MAVTLSTLLSGEQWKPELHETILANVARADEAIASQLKPLVKKPRLVLTLNGMRDFNLHYELLRTAEKALRLYGADLQVLTRLNKVKETASVFLEHSFALLADRFAVTAAQYGISCSGEPLKQRLLQALDNELGKEFNIINDVYTEFNGHPIRLDEGVSASQVLDTLLTECCGLHGQFDSIVIFLTNSGAFWNMFLQTLRLLAILHCNRSLRLFKTQKVLFSSSVLFNLILRATFSVLTNPATSAATLTDMMPEKKCI